MMKLKIKKCFTKKPMKKTRNQKNRDQIESKNNRW
jgi:hypothetical protein